MRTLLVDCRSAAAYARGHIPGAVHLDPETALSEPGRDASDGGRHPLPPADKLAADLRRRRDRRVDVRARNRRRLRLGRALLVAAPPRRARPCRNDRPSRIPRAGRDRVEPLRARDVRRRTSADDDTIGAEEILARLDDPSLVLLDARAPERWRGDVEPLDPVAGRIPGALNTPFTEPLPDGLTAARELVAYCGSGVTAAVVVQRLVLAGQEDARMYPGSFSEWCRRRGTPDREELAAMSTPYDAPSNPAKRQSSAMTDGPDRAGARSMLKATGFTDEDLAKPIVGVGTTWIETMPCNLNQRDLAVHVKRGVRDAGGTPMEFNTVAVSDGVSMGTLGNARVARLARGDRRLDRARRARSPLRRARLPRRLRQDEPRCGDGRRPPRHPLGRLLHRLDRTGSLSRARGVGRRRLRGDRRARGGEDLGRRPARARVGRLSGRRRVRRSVHREHDVDDPRLPRPLTDRRQRDSRDAQGEGGGRVRDRQARGAARRRTT